MTFLRVIVGSLVACNLLLYSTHSVTCRPHFIKGAGRSGHEHWWA